MPQVGEGAMLERLGAKSCGFARVSVVHDGNVGSDGRMDCLHICMVGCLRG